MSHRLRSKGKVIAQHMHLRTRIVCEYKGEGKDRKIVSSKIFIFNGSGKKKVGDTENGYKNREEAIEVMKKIYEEQKNKIL